MGKGLKAEEKEDNSSLGFQNLLNLLWFRPSREQKLRGGEAGEEEKASQGKTESRVSKSPERKCGIPMNL